MTAEPLSQIIHATSVAVDRRAVLIIGRSGSGKSSLALQLMAFGADLIADDRTSIRCLPEGLHVSCPEQIVGMIEARGVGIFQGPSIESAPLTCIIDLDREETERLPPPHTHQILGVTLPCLWRVAGPHFPGAILHYMRGAIPLRP